MKVLIVEDEPGLTAEITKYLNVEGDVCEACSTLGAATHKLSTNNYDCVLLDIGLPDGDGLEVLKFLSRSQRNESVIIISAKNALQDRLIGLDIGADDYLIKPFHLAELKARLTAVFRRKGMLGDHNIVFNELAVDIIHRSLTIHNTPIILTKKEFDLLIYFIFNQGKVISKNAIAEHLWRDETDMHDSFDFIYTHIKNLRKKLVEAGCKDYLMTIYGIGYKFTT